MADCVCFGLLGYANKLCQRSDLDRTYHAMDKPPIIPDNPYQAPLIAPPILPPPIVSEERTASGSFVRIIPRKPTAGLWSMFSFSIGVGFHLVSLGLIGIVAGILSERTEISLELCFLLCLAGFVPIYLLLIPWYRGAVMTDFTRRRKGFRKEHGFITELVFVPRLPATFSEARTAGDDYGVLSFERGFLRYTGERMEIMLHRSDLCSVRRDKAGAATLGVINPEMVLEFAHPLQNRTKLRFAICEGMHTVSSILRARQMARAMEEWFHAGSAGTTEGHTSQVPLPL